jgi:hypothetical protein
MMKEFWEKNDFESYSHYSLSLFKVLASIFQSSHCCNPIKKMFPVNKSTKIHFTLR